MELKKNKRTTIQSILDNFIKDGYISFLLEEVEGERERIQQYRELEAELLEEAIEEQKHYVGYEKEFFAKLEAFVIKKKLAGNLKKALQSNNNK